MLATLRARLTFANVCSFLALLIALGTGSAYAANTVFSEDIVNGEVKTADLDNNSVRSTKIGNAQVLNQDLGADAGQRLEDRSTRQSRYADTWRSNSVDSPQILSDAVGATEVADNSIDSGEIANDSLFDDDLASSSVGTSEITAGAVGNADLANSAVNGAKVANNSLTTADTAGTDANGAISLGAGSVPNGRCKSYDITVGGGATANETLVISTRATTQAGILIYGQSVPADGHGTMIVCNMSGTTQEAIVVPWPSAGTLWP